MDGTQIHIRNRVEEMPAIVSMVEDFGARHHIPPALVNDLNLCLDEVISNIISYGYPGGAKGEITVLLSYQAGQLTTEIRDDGAPFDPSRTDPPDLSGTVQTRKVGGLGIYFVRQLMDDVVYHRAGNENRLMLKKNIPI
jgi:anti-sigma regulatory factor (Ser/Thr protein kinase)